VPKTHPDHRTETKTVSRSTTAQSSLRPATPTDACRFWRLLLDKLSNI